MLLTDPLFRPLRFPDGCVRGRAVEWLSHLSDDDLCDILPQLALALRHETYLPSSMAELLLGRAAHSPRIAHHLYW